MPNSNIRPVVIRCPHVARCKSDIICQAFGAVKTEVQSRGYCPEATGVTANSGETSAYGIDAGTKTLPADQTVILEVDASDSRRSRTGDENG